jgi:hypothetical protein
VTGNEPGTLIRWLNFKKRSWRGAKGIGPGTEVSFSAGDWIERFEPEGTKNPKGEQKCKHQPKLLN